MITTQQFRRLRQLSKTEPALAIAAAKAGMDEKTARKWRRLGQPPDTLKKIRTYRTRPDPFADVWSEIEWELKEEASLQANEILRRLLLRHPGQFPNHQIRTLQRRVSDWRLQRMKESVGVIAPNLEALFVLPPQNQHDPRNVASNIFT